MQTKLSQKKIYDILNSPLICVFAKTQERLFSKHERFGRDFSKDPLITKWDAEHKINLFGHSFGGVTVRLLAHLMAEGSQEERDAIPPDELSPLFKGGHMSLQGGLTIKNPGLLEFYVTHMNMINCLE